MKKNQIVLIIIGFILLALMATNPSIDDHRQAIMEEIKKKMSQESDPGNKWEQVGQAIGMAFGQGIIEKSVTRDNYLVFSITKISFGDKSKNIGFGILGQVFLQKFDDIKKEFEEKSDEIVVKNKGDIFFMTENLNVDRFRNGDLIPQAASAEYWENAGRNKQPAWCYYDNDIENEKKFGKIYNWYAVNDPRGLAPDGWHIPSRSEWQDLEILLGEEAGKKLKSNDGWDRKNFFFSGNGKNYNGFSAYPAGGRFSKERSLFGRKGNLTGFWCMDELNNANSEAKVVGLSYDSNEIDDFVVSKSDGWSVRCIKD